jgi:hypothetical protein
MRLRVGEIPVDRLRARLAEDGDPPIRLARDGEELVFSADTAETMLRARVFATLDDVGTATVFYRASENRGGRRARARRTRRRARARVPRSPLE